MNISTTKSTIHSELPADVLIAGYLDQCGKVHDWRIALRLKWILNSETSTQTTEDEFIARATREQFKGL